MLIVSFSVDRHWDYMKGDLAEDIADGKALWRATADGELHDADTENYLTLTRMTAVRR